jgi:ribonuclease R
VSTKIGRSKTRKQRAPRAPGTRASRDPFFDREAARYEDPIPSREFILQTLTEAGVPLEERELAKRLKVARRQLETLERRIAAMERVGQLIRNRKGELLIARKLDLIPGRIAAHPDGFGFLAPDEGVETGLEEEGDLYIGQREMRKVLHGDRVMARVVGQDRRGRPEAVIVEVLERKHTELVGRLMREHDVMFVSPSDRRISHRVLVSHKEAGEAKPGQVVVVQLVTQPAVDARDDYTPPVGRVSEIVGNATDPGIEIEIALRKHDLPFEFSPAATAQAAKLPAQVRRSDWEGRESLLDLDLVTIDGETAKDFDDAVYAEREGRGFRLVVAIADVSHYVEPGSPLDKDALERGTSVYFPRRVIPMLPEKLSNGLCSLNPDVERLCMVCDMAIGPNGEIRKYRFFSSVMRSRSRLTYTKVAAALADPNGDAVRSLGVSFERIRVLEELFRVLLKAREKRGAIDFESLETQFVFDSNGRLERIERVQRNDAHRLIEECMLAANVCASDILQKAEHPALYRVHEGPTSEKLKALRDFLKSFGLQLGGGEKPSAKEYAKLTEQVKGRPDAPLLQTVLLRSLQQAVYSPENAGHFGLAYEAYTHFTSPIRRYPDLLVHRAIKAVVGKKTYKPGNWVALGQHCSDTERRADEASREVESWLKAYYMKDRVGEEFDGVITAVTSFGIFVALDNLYVEGLVHVSELGRDYFRYDPIHHEMLGGRTGKRFRLADRIRIKVARVDLETSRLEFVLPDVPK